MFAGFSAFMLSKMGVYPMGGYLASGFLYIFYKNMEFLFSRKFDSLPPSSTQMQFHFIPYFSWFSSFLFCQIFEIFL